MGILISYFSSEIACCIGSAACKCCFTIFGMAASKATRIAYGLNLLATSILAWIMLSDWAIDLIEKRFNANPFYRIDCKICYGALASIRVLCGLTVFHLLMSLLTIGIKSTNDPRAAVQNGFWGFKLVLIGLLILGCFYMPNDFFMGYGKFSMFPAAIFILVQLILLIDVAYRWSEKCLEEYDESESNVWLAILAGGTLILLTVVSVSTGLLYYYFGLSECQLNLFFISMNLIFAIIVCLASIHPYVQEANPQSGLPPASFVATYCTYLLFSAISNEPEPHCNPLVSDNDPRSANILIGAFITFVALTYSVTTTATSGNSFIGGDDQRMMLLRPEESTADENTTEFEDEEDCVAYNYAFFHLIFAVASMYISNLLTNWDSISAEQGSHSVIIGQTWTAVWIKVVTSWLTYLLFLWTLIAPIVLPDRDWN